ncbi:MAG: hypothetical protein V1792_29330 [Pseudomonadota bacterium]
MRTVIPGLILVILLGTQAFAQLSVVPGGGMLPDGSVRFTIPAGVPYTAPHYAQYEAYGAFGHYMSSPVYPISYPYVPVPMAQPGPENSGR